ncbi:MAG: DUF2145 domain-containing protein [Comamonas sp.]
MLKTAFTTLALAVALSTGTAHAGRSCEPRKHSVDSVRQSLALAQNTVKSLDASGAQVALLGRQGQDLSKYGLEYSHMGWAYKSATGDWRVVHKLNDCGTADSHVYRQGLGEFFLDDLWRYKAVVMVPTEAVQKKLLLALSSNQQALQLHDGRYSMVAYAWGQRYQQSNQWALETLAGAMEPQVIRSRQQAQAWLQLQGYQPGDLRIGSLTRLGGRLTRANIAFDDHPSEKRFAGHIETATVDSALRFMQQSQLGTAPFVVR